MAVFFRTHFHVFGGEKNGIARGRLRWKLVEEGRALELDISAKRCTIVKTRVMRGTPNADMEGKFSFDISLCFPTFNARC